LESEEEEERMEKSASSSIDTDKCSFEMLVKVFPRSTRKPNCEADSFSKTASRNSIGME
jgi:hypothetical protein